jgi:serine protease Do
LRRRYIFTGGLDWGRADALGAGQEILRSIMKRTFFGATYLGCIALLGLALQTVPLQARDNGTKTKRADNGEKPADSGATNPPPKFHVDTSPIERQGANSFAPVVKKVAPSVVSVYSSRTVQDPDMRSLQNDLLRRFFGGEAPDDQEDQPEQQQPRRNNRNRRQQRSHHEEGLGSGVIVTEDGYILTNNHVIEDADDVKVQTPGGARYAARVVGTDAASDIALIKIDGKDLPAMTMGDSEGLQVGDVVLAIGNPFGIGQTVTMGIVSALGRTDLRILGNSGYEDFIQTDAAINLGNSGGALIDAQGRLVGLNAAILSRTGGNVGVGFAVPINMARNVIESLTKYGHVMRGFLGIAPQPVGPEMARAFNLPEGATGALVGDFPRNEDGSPGPSVARDAGIEVGDIITEFNGKKVTDDLHLRLIVSQTPPNTESTIKVIRDGKEKTFKLKLAELPNRDIAANDAGQPGNNSTDNESLEGVTVDDIDAQARSQFKIPRTVQGAIVSDVDPDSKSYEAGLRAGDVITEINHKPVRDAKDAVALSEKAKGPDTLLRIYTHGNSRFLAVENGTNEPSTLDKKDNKKSNKSRR